MIQEAGKNSMFDDIPPQLFRLNSIGIRRFAPNERTAIEQAYQTPPRGHMRTPLPGPRRNRDIRSSKSSKVRHVPRSTVNPDSGVGHALESHRITIFGPRSTAPPSNDLYPPFVLSACLLSEPHVSRELRTSRNAASGRRSASGQGIHRRVWRCVVATRLLGARRANQRFTAGVSDPWKGRRHSRARRAKGDEGPIARPARRRAL